MPARQKWSTYRLHLSASRTKHGPLTSCASCWPCQISGSPRRRNKTHNALQHHADGATAWKCLICVSFALFSKSYRHETLVGEGQSRRTYSPSNGISLSLFSRFYRDESLDYHGKNLDNHSHQDTVSSDQSCQSILDRGSPASHIVLIIFDTESPITVQSAAQETTEDLAVPIQE